MHRIRKTLAFTTFAVLLGSSALPAQGRRDDHNNNNNRGGYVRHDDWKKGSRMNRNDWNRGQRFDYRRYHLSAPPRGYEWRQVDGNYVMAAVATGVIASVIAAAAAH